MRCVLLDIGDTDNVMSLKADKLVAEQLPDRADIFHAVEIQKAELEDFNEKTNTMIAQFENQMNQPLQRYDKVPKNSSIGAEFVKCGKESCNDCPHGPYYYVYWRDNNSKKLKKKYEIVLTHADKPLFRILFSMKS